jgi:hypothetical protein
LEVLESFFSEVFEEPGLDVIEAFILELTGDFILEVINKDFIWELIGDFILEVINKDFILEIFGRLHP